MGLFQQCFKVSQYPTADGDPGGGVRSGSDMGLLQHGVSRCHSVNCEWRLMGWGERSGSAYTSLCQRGLAEYIIYFVVCCCYFLSVVLLNDESEKIRGIFGGLLGSFQGSSWKAYRGVLVSFRGSSGES